MLLDCYFIDDDGVETKVEPKNVRITHDSLLIVESHRERILYIFKGRETSIRQKFASARIASAKRLSLGYKIRHIEELEGIDEDFKPILDFLGGIKELPSKPTPSKKGGEPKTSSTTKKKTTTKKTAPAAKKTATTTKKTTTTAKKKTTTKKAAATTKKTTTTKGTTKKSTTQTKTTSKTQKPKTPSTSNILQRFPPELEQVIKTVLSLDPPEESTCDYLLVGSNLYILLGENKQDLRKGEFKLEQIKSLPEGVFPATDYFPRILISNKEIVGVELWKKNSSIKK